MAIIKPIETPHGIIATYHKLLKAEVDAQAQTIMLVVAMYASAEARDAGRNVLWHEYQAIPFSALTQDPRGLLYPLLAAYGDSFLLGGAPDSSLDGFVRPGGAAIELRPEAHEPTPPLSVEEPEHAAMAELTQPVPFME